MVGRLKPGVTPAQAQQDVGGAQREIVRNFRRPWPAFASTLCPAAWRSHPGAGPATGPHPVSGCCGGSVHRLREFGRIATGARDSPPPRNLCTAGAGASSGAVLRQSLVEALLLSVGGGLLGLALAATALSAGIRLLPETLPRIGSIGHDWEVVGFALLLAVLTGLLCGAIPAFAASRTSVNDALKEGGRIGTAGSGHARLRSALVVAELAVALVLLTASGLLLRSFEKLRAVDLGFRTDHMLTASYGLPHQQYSTQAAADAFDAELLRKLQQLPGVEAVGLTSSLPQPDKTMTKASTRRVTSRPGRRSTFRLALAGAGRLFPRRGHSLLRGRGFTPADTATSPLVIVVNRKLAERFWPGQDPSASASTSA